MTKKFVSLLMLVVMVVGILPVMSVSAEVTIDKYDTFETYTVKEFNTNYDASTTLPTIYDTGDSNTYNQKWGLGKDISLRIKEMNGYDGELTNVAELTINSCGGWTNNGTQGSLRFSWNSDSIDSGVFVQEMDVYITDTPEKNIYMTPIFIKGSKIGFGAGRDDCTMNDVTSGWHRVKAVTIFGGTGNNVIGYIDGKCVSYKEYTATKASRIFQVYAPGSKSKGFYHNGYQTIIFDNIKLWSNPEATTASSVYSDASNVSSKVSPVINFSESLLNTSVHSDGIISADNIEFYKSSDSSATVEINEPVISADNKSITIDPVDELEGGVEYTVTVKDLKDMYGRDIPSATFSFTTAEASSITVSQPVFTKENLFVAGGASQNLTSLENGYIKASSTVSNSANTPKEVMVLAMLKDGDDIKYFQFKNITVPATGSATFTGGFQVDNASTQKIETVVWDSIYNKTPLADKYAFSSSGLVKTALEDLLGE